MVIPALAVLIVDGFHVPVTPLFDVCGSDGAVGEEACCRGAWRCLGAVPLDDGKADVHHGFRHGLALGAVGNQLRRRLAHAGAVDAHGGRRRMGVRRAGQVISKDEMTEQALNRKLTPYDRSIDVHVSNIRKKITAAGSSKDLIINVRGAGYMLTMNDDDSAA